MTFSHLRNLLFLLDLLVVVSVQASDLDVSGEALTTRFWDCCKPSCGWPNKASVTRPVLSCAADGDSPVDVQEGTGCGTGGSAYVCSDQQPWAINDTHAYGFAGAFTTEGRVENAWCCACYELNFTSDPLRGKTMIIQASNTAYDINTRNRFSLAVPGGNTTQFDGCTKQYGVEQSVFGQAEQGVSSVNDCQNLPEHLRAGCEWRFDWFQDASFPTATFRRVVCPTELTDKTQCIRDDDRVLSGEVSSANALWPATSSLVTITAVLSALLLA